MVKEVLAVPGTVVYDSLMVGSVSYELSNHLQNVLVTISDKKIGHTTDGTTIDYYNADVITAKDYYPFGSLMPGRKYSQSNTTYRYGFNGKEKDNEAKGEGNAYDYGARIYDPRLGRWLSTDPLQQKYADLSPYNYCANSPISAKDPDGRLIIFINGLWTPGTGINQPLKPYWSSYDRKDWIKQAQDRTGDHAQPRYYDGSVGGTPALIMYGITNKASYRESEGKNAGYKDAKAIIGGLSKGENIKIVTNSMGTAFAHGFTKGILQYQAEENESRSDFNSSIDTKVLLLSLERGNLAKQMDKVLTPQTTDKNTQIYKSINSINTKIS